MDGREGYTGTGVAAAVMKTAAAVVGRGTLVETVGAGVDEDSRWIRVGR